MSDRTHPLRDVLSALAAVLDRTGTRWYVFDAQAVVVYGRPQLTADLDVTVDVRLESWQELEALDRRDLLPELETLHRGGD